MNTELEITQLSAYLALINTWRNISLHLFNHLVLVMQLQQDSCEFGTICVCVCIALNFKVTNS